MKKYVYLVRHAEPEEGFTRRYLGRLNPGLSAKGVGQARRIAERVRRLSPDCVLSSPLRRAGETAAIIAGACGLEVETNDLLLEINFGKLEGMTFKEASALYPGATDSWQALSGDFSFPDGENFAAFNRRAADMTEHVRARPERRVALVAHGGVLRGILCRLLSVEADGPLRFRLAYASLTAVELYEDGGAILTGFNVGREDAPTPPAPVSDAMQP